MSTSKSNASSEENLAENSTSKIADLLNSLALNPSSSFSKKECDNETRQNDANDKDTNTVEVLPSLKKVAETIKSAKKIVIVTGAGISVSCGIPDFRSSKGLYATLRKTYPQLSDPTDIFNMKFFKQDPRVFYDFAQELWPGNFAPSPTHKFMTKLDKQGKLLRNYTQNIDTLEQVAGMDNIVQCHGSFEKATCLRCKKKYVAADIKEAVFKKEIPYCDCSEDRWDESWLELNNNNLALKKWYPVIKPDIVFFGEQLPDVFHKKVHSDAKNADLVIVIGSSMLVGPVNSIPDMCRNASEKILINKEELTTSYTRYDQQLYGYCDTIIESLEELIFNEGTCDSKDGESESTKVENGQGSQFQPQTNDPLSTFTQVQVLNDLKNSRKNYFVKDVEIFGKVLTKFAFDGCDAKYIMEG